MSSVILRLGTRNHLHPVIANVVKQSHRKRICRKSDCLVPRNDTGHSDVPNCGEGSVWLKQPQPAGHSGFSWWKKVFFAPFSAVLRWEVKGREKTGMTLSHGSLQNFGLVAKCSFIMSQVEQFRRQRDCFTSFAMTNRGILCHYVRNETIRNRLQYLIGRSRQRFVHGPRARAVVRSLNFHGIIPRMEAPL